jgi:hypothetical protein
VTQRTKQETNKIFITKLFGVRTPIVNRASHVILLSLPVYFGLPVQPYHKQHKGKDMPNHVHTSPLCADKDTFSYVPLFVLSFSFVLSIVLARVTIKARSQ